MRQLALVPGLGCLLGALIWLAFGRLDNPVAPDGNNSTPPPPPAQTSIADALSMPIFSAGPTTIVAPTQETTSLNQSSVKLLGISYTPRRHAALLSSGGPGFWLSVGQSQDGIQLTALQRTSAVLDINGAAVTLELFKQPSAPIVSPPPSPSLSPPPPSTPPKGKEPASAPGMAPELNKADPPQPKPNSR